MTNAHIIPVWFPRGHWSSWWANASLYEQQKNTTFMRAQQRIMLPPSVKEYNSSSLIIMVRLGHDSSALLSVDLNLRQYDHQTSQALGKSVANGVAARAVTDSGHTTITRYATQNLNPLSQENQLLPPSHNRCNSSPYTTVTNICQVVYTHLGHCKIWMNQDPATVRTQKKCTLAPTYLSV